MIGLLSIRDLEFEIRCAEIVTPSGIKRFRAVNVGMPKIPQYVLDCVFFLFRSREEAEAGTAPEGTGFVAAVPSQAIPGAIVPPHYYAFTNWHVMRNAPVLRLNTMNGKSRIIELDQAIDWHFIPGGNPQRGDDVAIAMLDLEETDRVHAIDFGLFIGPNQIRDMGVGVGDDVFMIGLFVDHHGHTTNLPKARFGNISMMPDDRAPIAQANGTIKSSYVLDMHSRSGFSGSPVFFYRTIGSDLRHANMSSMMINEPTRFGFLGIHWGQFPEEFKVGDKYGKEIVLEGMSGMTCVIPAWRLCDLMNIPEIQRVRVQREAAQRQDPRLRRAPRAETSSDEHS